MTRPIHFNRQTGEYGYLSNFFAAPIMVPDPIWGELRQWPTNENYFQCCKLRVEKITSIQRTDEMISRFRVATPAQAKVLGRELDIDLDRWDFEEAMPAMLRCNLAKFAQHEDLRDKLIATGDAVLVEHRPDPVWGDNMDDTGLNLLGLTLMLVRARVSA